MKPLILSTPETTASDGKTSSQPGQYKQQPTYDLCPRDADNNMTNHAAKNTQLWPMKRMTVAGLATGTARSHKTRETIHLQADKETLYFHTD